MRFLHHPLLSPPLFDSSINRLGVGTFKLVLMVNWVVILNNMSYFADMCGYWVCVSWSTCKITWLPMTCTALLQFSKMKWLNDKKKEWTKEQEHVWRKYVKAERWGNKEKTSVLEENVIWFYTHTHTHTKNTSSFSLFLYNQAARGDTKGFVH